MGRLNELVGTHHGKLGISGGMEVRREEYLDYMTFRANERPLFMELFGPIVGLKDEWRAQGATEAELDFSAFRYRRAAFGGAPVNAGGFTGGIEDEILEETDDYVIGRDGRGRTVKLFKKAATLPLPLDFPVKTMDDWLRIKPQYEFSEARFGADWERVARDHLDAGRVVSVSIPGGFDEPRQLMGEEELCIAYYEQPELVHDMLDTMGRCAEQVLDRVSKTVTVDRLSVHEDMAGKSGSLAGPKQIREFIAPYYRRIWDMLRDRGARLFDQDSDGDMNGVLDAFLEAGLNVIHPVEPAANMDPVAIREKYGARLALIGGLDKHVVRRSKDEIRAELEYKLPPLVATGGVVFSLDHRIPNGTPLEHYRYYVETAWEILDREAAKLGG